MFYFSNVRIMKPKIHTEIPLFNLENNSDNTKLQLHVNRLRFNIFVI